ncbi:MAG: hypothetical protein QOI22_43 [Verrucomicrobiota bacterium]
MVLAILIGTATTYAQFSDRVPLSSMRRVKPTPTATPVPAKPEADDTSTTLQRVPPPAQPVIDVPPGLVASPHDAARFLAGMPVSPDSPLAPFEQTPVWQEHAKSLEERFTKLIPRFTKIATWRAAFLPESNEQMPVAFYMFSGPDFLYVDQFFPNASVYVLCGTEPIGPAPDPLRLNNMWGALVNLQNSMNSLLRFSFFITKDMKTDLQQELRGTLPVFYVLIARANKTIKDVTFISLNRNGTFQENSSGKTTGGTPGVRITYTDNATGRTQTMFYFTTDISDSGIKSNPGFLNFCQHFGVGASLLKSSSYLMFENGFSTIRNFLLDHSRTILQDDAGIPLAYFNRDKWNLRLFGTYAGPIETFKQHYQPGLRELYEQTNPPPLDFGFGYQWNYKVSNLIVAQRN